jgi:hypothetical protein
MPISASQNHPINCGLATTSSFSRQFAKKTVANRAIDVVAFEVNRANGTLNESSTETIGDAVYNKNTFSQTVTDCSVNIAPVKQQLERVISIESSNTSILANPQPNDPFYLAYQADGTVSIVVTLSNNEKAATSFQTKTKTPAPVYVFNNHVVGSLSKHILNQAEAIANNSTSPPNHYPIYSTFNQQSNVYLKNSGFYANSLDFSGITVNKVGSGGVTSVTAITPRHAIGAAHYPPEVNDVMYFCDSNNQTVARTVVNRSFSNSSDSVIVKFDQDLPPTVKKYKFLPASWSNFIPINYPEIIAPSLPASSIPWYSGYAVPLVITSHYRWDENWPLQRSNRYAYIVPSFVSYFINNAQRSNANIAGFPAGFLTEPNVNKFANYNGDGSGIQGGDSGLPCFYIINNDLTLVMKHTGAANGAMLSDFLGDINTSISLLGAEGHNIQTIDLSGFTNFSS